MFNLDVLWVPPNDSNLLDVFNRDVFNFKWSISAANRAFTGELVASSESPVPLFKLCAVSTCAFEHTDEGQVHRDKTVAVHYSVKGNLNKARLNLQRLIENMVPKVPNTIMGIFYN